MVGLSQNTQKVAAVVSSLTISAPQEGQIYEEEVLGSLYGQEFQAVFKNEGALVALCPRLTAGYIEYVVGYVGGTKNGLLGQERFNESKARGCDLLSLVIQEERLGYDLYYVKHRTLGWEFSIFTRYIAKVISGRMK